MLGITLPFQIFFAWHLVNFFSSFCRRPEIHCDEIQYERHEIPLILIQSVQCVHYFSFTIGEAYVIMVQASDQSFQLKRRGSIQTSQTCYK